MITGVGLAVLSALAFAGDTPSTSAISGASKEEIREWMNRPFPANSYRAAEVLHVDVELADSVRKVCELIYLRHYPEAKALLDQLGVQYPTLGVGPVGIALIYQALMFENYDFRYEKQYEAAKEGAYAQLKEGMTQPGNEALETMFLTLIRGVDAIHALRKGEVLPALDKALSAMNALETLKKLSPELPDLKLADGIYLYWRSSITLSSKLLPDFPDKRADGLALMRQAEVGGYFVGPASSLGMAYSYLEERKYRDALDKCLYLRQSYPDNVINNMTLGRIYSNTNRYDSALKVYEEVKADDRDNQRVYFQEGQLFYRMQKYPEAEQALRVYLGFPDLSDDARASTQYRLGTVYQKMARNEEAKIAFQEAVKINGHKAAKKALARME